LKIWIFDDLSYKLKQAFAIFFIMLEHSGEQGNNSIWLHFCDVNSIAAFKIKSHGHQGTWKTTN
jgi:hypothetical protein